jgi:hypothetical protein
LGVRDVRHNSSHFLVQLRHRRGHIIRRRQLVGVEIMHGDSYWFVVLRLRGGEIPIFLRELHRPEMLGRLEFRGIGWQELQADAFGDL